MLTIFIESLIGIEPAGSYAVSGMVSSGWLALILKGILPLKVINAYEVKMV